MPSSLVKWSDDGECACFCPRAEAFLRFFCWEPTPEPTSNDDDVEAPLHFLRYGASSRVSLSALRGRSSALNEHFPLELELESLMLDVERERKVGSKRMCTLHFARAALRPSDPDRPPSWRKKSTAKPPPRNPESTQAPPPPSETESKTEPDRGKRHCVATVFPPRGV